MSSKPKRRSRNEILLCILQIAENEKTKTYIMYKANVSYRLLVGYLNDLTHLGLLDEILERNQVRQKSRIVFKTSHKGMSLLKDYKEFQKLSEKIANCLSIQRTN